MKYKSHFKFNKQERSGIFFLLLIIISLQVGYFTFRSFSSDDTEIAFSSDAITQASIDALKVQALVADTIKIYPFNPNFITDYKGYTLGMSVVEIDRLHAFRSENKYVNSQEDFQKVTHVSDSLLKEISPYFKFPEWTKKRKEKGLSGKPFKTKGEYSNASFGKSVIKEVIQIKDLNAVTAEELRSINGIGEKLSARIIKFRDRLGGFLVDDQLYDVYGLESAVVERALMKYKVLEAPEIKKINVNWASYNELRNVLYINHIFAKSIIEHRNNITIRSLSELNELEGFPEGKFERLDLYLSF